MLQLLKHGAVPSPTALDTALSSGLWKGNIVQVLLDYDAVISNRALWNARSLGDPVIMEKINTAIRERAKQRRVAGRGAAAAEVSQIVYMVADFVPEDPDEIALFVGDILLCQLRYADSWCLVNAFSCLLVVVWRLQGRQLICTTSLPQGMSQTRSTTGIFPGVCVSQTPQGRPIDSFKSRTSSAFRRPMVDEHPMLIVVTEYAPVELGCGTCGSSCIPCTR